MVFCHTDTKKYEDEYGDPYWMSSTDYLEVKSNIDKVCISMRHNGSYSVHTAITLSKEEAKRLRDELDRLINR